MSYKIFMSQASIDDLTKAEAFYEEQKRGLGKRLRKEVRTVAKRLMNTPKMYAIRYVDVHVAPLNVFPFTLHYQVEEQQKIVSLIAVFHDSQDSSKWAERIE